MLGWYIVRQSVNIEFLNVCKTFDIQDVSLIAARGKNFTYFGITWVRNKPNKKFFWEKKDQFGMPNLLPNPVSNQSIVFEIQLTR